MGCANEGAETRQVALALGYGLDEGMLSSFSRFEKLDLLCLGLIVDALRKR